MLASKIHYQTLFSFRFNPNTHMVSLVDSVIVRIILEKCEYHCDFGFGWFSEPSEELTVVSLIGETYCILRGTDAILDPSRVIIWSIGLPNTNGLFIGREGGRYRRSSTRKT